LNAWRKILASSLSLCIPALSPARRGLPPHETLPLPTKHISGPEVLRFRDRAFNEYFSNPKYLEKVRREFGHETEQAIKDMLKKQLKRKYLDLPERD
jgi:hypothetical protein